MSGCLVCQVNSVLSTWLVLAAHKNNLLQLLLVWCTLYTCGWITYDSSCERKVLMMSIRYALEMRLRGRFQHVYVLGRPYPHQWLGIKHTYKAINEFIEVKS